MEFSIRTLYVTPYQGQMSTDPMDAIKTIVSGEDNVDSYGGMMLFSSTITEITKKLGVFYDGTLMRIVETNEEGEELINRFKKACSLLEELPLDETASIIKLFHQADTFGRGTSKNSKFINDNENTKILEI